MGERFKANVTGEFVIFKLNGEKPNWLNFISNEHFIVLPFLVWTTNRERKRDGRI